MIAVRVRKLAPEEVWRPRYEHIREFERLLDDEGTTLVKIFLHVSKEEQGKRLQERLDDPEKRWKFRLGDLDDRALWDDFTEAYEDADPGDLNGLGSVVASFRPTATGCATSRSRGSSSTRSSGSTRKLPPPDPQLEGMKVV